MVLDIKRAIADSALFVCIRRNRSCAEFITTFVLFNIAAVTLSCISNG